MTELAWRVWLVRAQLRFQKANPVVMAMVLMACLLVVVLTGVMPELERSVLRERLAVAELRMKLKQAPIAQEPAPESVSDQNLSAFRDTLGDGRHLEQPVGALFAIAQSVGLELLQAQYKLQCNRASEACIYRVDLPVNGQYGAVRWFAEQAMATLPYASLDEVRFKREDVQDDTLEARLVFSLHVTTPAAMQAPAGGKP
jgi:hypothetical protein